MNGGTPFHSVNSWLYEQYNSSSKLVKPKRISPRAPPSRTLSIRGNAMRYSEAGLWLPTWSHEKRTAMQATFIWYKFATSVCYNNGRPTGFFFYATMPCLCVCKRQFAHSFTGWDIIKHYRRYIGYIYILLSFYIYKKYFCSKYGTL